MTKDEVCKEMPLDIQVIRNKSAHEYAETKRESFGDMYTNCLISYKSGFDCCYRDMKLSEAKLKAQLEKAIEQRNHFIKRVYGVDNAEIQIKIFNEEIEEAGK